MRSLFFPNGSRLNSEKWPFTHPALPGRTLAADALIASTYLAGTNTRRVRRALAAVFGGAVSKDTVSRVWRKVKTNWDAWNARSLAAEPIVRLDQFYFATERGRSGYEKYRREFSKLIWQLASPKWQFDDTTFNRSAAAFDNPDHVSIVIHNYRWRLGLAEGEPKYAGLESRLAEFPVITVPTITLEGDANGAPHPDPSTYAKKFSGKYSHRLIKGGIGHNLPQEAPKAFAEAVIDIAEA